VPVATVLSLVAASAASAAASVSSSLVVSVALARVHGLAWLAVRLGVVPAVDSSSFVLLPLILVLEGRRHFDHPCSYLPVDAVQRVDGVAEPNISPHILLSQDFNVLVARAAHVRITSVRTAITVQYISGFFFSDFYRMDSLYRAVHCACMERGNITSGAKIYIYSGRSGHYKDKLSLFCPPFLI
jgi:hypothetical protein